VELGASYSNREADVARLRLARMAAETPRPAEGSRKPGQHQRRLSMTEVAELIKEYERGVMVKELAERFGVH
jgi:hypothetical protein